MQNTGLDNIMSSCYTVIIECTLQDTPTELPPAASCPVTVSIYRFIIMQYAWYWFSYCIHTTGDTVRRQDTHKDPEVDLSMFDLLTASS